MRTFYRPFGVSQLFLVAVVTIAQMWSLTLLAQERPWSVSPCELIKRPGMYADAMVSVPGLVLYGPNQFTTHGYDCPDEYGVLRLEFGGNPTDPEDQFRLPQERLEAGTVPLKRDADYETMQRLLKQVDASGKVQMLRATLTGRFFAGPAFGTKSGEIKHPNARLVISEVELVSNKLEDPVDFTPPPNSIPKPAKGCRTTELPVLSHEEDDKLQRLSREPSENMEYLSDPARVAAVEISALENLPAGEIAGKLKLTGEAIALKDFGWTTPDGRRSYAITVNRPFWLLPSTYSGDTVIWVPKRTVKTVCSAKPAR